jgi:hypothetical protein
MKREKGSGSWNDWGWVWRLLVILFCIFSLTIYFADVLAEVVIALLKTWHF